MVDLAIVAIVLIGALIGFRKGFVVPLVGAGGALATMAMLYAGPFNGALPSGAVGLGASAIALAIGATLFTKLGMVAVGIVHRFGFLRRFDQVLGIPLGMATAGITLYVAVVATVVVDGWLAPLHGKVEIGTKEIAALQAVVKANPVLGMFADPNTLQSLAQSAAKAPVTADQLAQVDAALGFYEKTVRPELLQSRIAPILLALGHNLPLVGREATFPAR
jgi:hypothetical protein